MKKLSLALSLAFGATALADVPALINYQGRLVDGVGNPIVGKKEFKLDIYDSQTEGTLIYQETLADITLDEDGAYSFQFGAGESRSETSVLVATGDGEAAFFQKVFEETPVGVISVTDGTNTFKTGDVPTGEEPFSFTYTASLKRLNLVCNEPPAEGTKFTATFRYAESGIMGALGSAAEHWMEVTIGGEKQEPRQRLVAVPFALQAGSVVTKTIEYYRHERVKEDDRGKYVFLIDSTASKLMEVSFFPYVFNDRGDSGEWKIERRPFLEPNKWEAVIAYTAQEASPFIVGYDQDSGRRTYRFLFESPIDLDPQFVYRITADSDATATREFSLKLQK
ncbi:hypothetical protein N9081_01805 [Akkermansiaceae bacterium]|nr:hypothetical protein [Akkermansiaceae bacterium]MDB4791581.1 hypothetical protein [Akkermansiaceae bacterium]